MEKKALTYKYTIGDKIGVFAVLGLLGLWIGYTGWASGVSYNLLKFLDDLVVFLAAGMVIGAPIILGSIFVIVFLSVKTISTAIGKLFKAEEDQEDLSHLMSEAHGSEHYARVLRIKARRMRVTGPVLRTVIGLMVIGGGILGVVLLVGAAIPYVKREGYIYNKVKDHWWTEDMGKYYRLTKQELNESDDYNGPGDSLYGKWMVKQGKWTEKECTEYSENKQYRPK